MRTGKRLHLRGLSVLLAHWALETGRGKHMMGHNFGGLKGSEDRGPTLRVWTRELKDGEYVPVQGRFRTYPDSATGARDYVQLLERRYPAAFQAVRDGDVESFVSALSAEGYFTEDVSIYQRAMRSLWFEFATNDLASPQANTTCPER